MSADTLKIFGQHDNDTVQQMYRCLAVGGVKGVLCADGHKGYAQPVGGVVAYENLISVSGVGFDIGCGNLALRTNRKAAQIKDRLPALMDDIFDKISFGMGRRNREEVEHPLFDDPAWSVRALAPLKELARQQLGTVGGGNHYVDIFEDEDGLVWVGVHFGSRGFGHKAATAFLHLAGGRDGMDVPPAVIRADTPLGQDYIAAMQLAGRYAYAGREYVARYVANHIMGAKIVEEVHNHHNFAWEEEHLGTKFWVVRKGATPAFPGQKGFVGGSMGDDAVIIEGVDSETSREAFYSTVHGAGRVMSRTQAKGKRGQAGRINRKQMEQWLQTKGVVLRGGDVDEAPQAYRRLKDVLAAHEGTIRVLHTLRPLGVAMAGPETFDPYKD